METINTDVLIIGSGAAGLAATVYAAQSGQNVLVIDKGAVGKSGSTTGAVQIASLGDWSDPRDNEDAYRNDIEESGRGLSDPKLTQTLAHDISERLQDLISWGLKLDVDEQKEVALSATSGHSLPRSISARKGKTGLGILQTLIRLVKKSRNVKTWSDVITLELVKSSGRISGAIVYDLRNNLPYFIESTAVILATGGIGQLYPVTSNPVQSTSDGFALGLGVGANLVDMEQVQFYPVSMVAPRSIAGFCISFYHYSKLYNSLGERFMKNYEPENMEDTTRDKLAIAIANEVVAGRGTPNGGVYLDGTEAITQIKKEFPHEYELCLDRGIDLAKHRAEVGPAAHFMMGGIQIDEHAASSVPGLFVAGETAGGLHGGNRLGNNALSECVVFGARAGMGAAEMSLKGMNSDHTDLEEWKDKWSPLFSTTKGKIRPYQLKQRIQEILGEHVGVIRSDKGLQQAKVQLKDVQAQLAEVNIKKDFMSREILDYIEVRHMIQTAQAIVGAAYMRKESRGAHYNTDYPSLAAETQKTNVQFSNGEFTFHTFAPKGGVS
ncbi:FAD-dependent oxidoreductase [Salinibacillus xinjiangensis]|nr:FAD-dependent oxidoreductase [Salinibacillus xinjiangensis]